MRASFSDVPLPATPDEVRALVEQAFLDLVGTSMHDPAWSVYVPAFETTGMSSRIVVPAFWAQTAVPRILEPWAAATAPDSLQHLKTQEEGPPLVRVSAYLGWSAAQLLSFQSYRAADDAETRHSGRSGASMLDT